MYDMIITRGIRSRDDLFPITKEDKDPIVMKNKISADTIYYVVATKVVDDFGVELTGIGSTPLVIFENSQTDESIGFYGSEELSAAKIIHTEDGGKNEILSKYIELVGLEDFQNSGVSISNLDLLVELVNGVINEDLSDFEFESELETALVLSDDFYNEEFLSSYIGWNGVWVSCRHDISASIDLGGMSIVVNGDAYDDLGTLANEVTISSGVNKAGLFN